MSTATLALLNLTSTASSAGASSASSQSANSAASDTGSDAQGSSFASLLTSTSAQTSAPQKAPSGNSASSQQDSSTTPSQPFVLQSVTSQAAPKPQDSSSTQNTANTTNTDSKNLTQQIDKEIETLQKQGLSLQDIATLLQSRGVNATDIQAAIQANNATTSDTATTDTTTQSTDATPTDPLQALLALMQQSEGASQASSSTDTTTTALATDSTADAGLFGTKGLDLDQSLQSLMARMSVATSSDASSSAQPQDASTASSTAPAPTEMDKLLALLQNGRSTPLLPTNESGQTSSSTTSQNPLLAIAQRANADTITTASDSSTAGNQPQPGSDPFQAFATFNPATAALLATQQDTDSNNDNSPSEQSAISALNSSIAHLGGQSLSQNGIQQPGGFQSDFAALVQNPGTPSDQVSVRIAQALQSGDSSISIQLQPDKLGHVQVQIDFSGHDGKANISIIADKASTLDALKSDSAGLSKALSDAGIKADAGSMQFSQRNPNAFSFFQQQGNGNGNNTYTPPASVTPTNDDLASANSALYRVYNSDRALDIVA